MRRDTNLADDFDLGRPLTRARERLRATRDGIAALRQEEARLVTVIDGLQKLAKDVAVKPRRNKS